MTDTLQPVRALVVSPYWSFWESSVETVDLRTERDNVVSGAVAALEAEGVEITARHFVEPPPAASVTAGALERLDVLIVVVTMAAPPTAVTRLLDQLPPSIPIVVWALLLPELGTAGTEEIVRNGTTVGTPLLTSGLARQGRDFRMVAGSRTSGAAARVSLVARALTLATRLPEMTLARIGDPLPGYDGVDAEDEALTAAFGLKVRRIEARVLARKAIIATAADVAAAREELETPIPDDTSANVDMSLRLRAALGQLTDEHDLACGAMNCHNRDLRHNPQTGITPCYALGAETTRGRPWTCTGDVVTAVAMLIAKRLSGAALYHEIESLEPETGIAVLANTGEFDLSWAHDASSVRARANPWYGGDESIGLSVSHDLRPGSATLVGVANDPEHPSGFRILTALGEVLSGHDEDLPTAGGRFRFNGYSPLGAWEDWVMSGATHHAALAYGDITEGVAVLAHVLGVGAVHLPRGQ